MKVIVFVKEHILHLAAEQGVSSDILYASAADSVMRVLR